MMFLPTTGGVTLKYIADASANGDPKLAVDKWTEEHCPLIHSHYDDDGGILFPSRWSVFHK